jgi:oxalate decarboxylase
MTYGNCRITVLDVQGRPYVADVKAGDLWYFPAGYPHSLQGLGPDGCEFVICFDDGMASEFNTLLVTDWLAHTPPPLLAQNFNTPVKEFEKIPLNDLWIFQGEVPGDLASVREAMTRGTEPTPYPYTFSLLGTPPASESKGGTVHIADSTNFKVATTIASALVTLRPGAMRQLHWHPNADEWQYWIKGKGRMGVFNTGPNVMTMDFTPGDVGYVKKNFGHYVQNVGDTDLQFFAVFRTDRYEQISLSDWLVHSPPEMVSEHFNIDPAVMARWPGKAPAIMPA